MRTNSRYALCVFLFSALVVVLVGPRPQAQSPAYGPTMPPLNDLPTPYLVIRATASVHSGS